MHLRLVRPDDEPRAPAVADVIRQYLDAKRCEVDLGTYAQSSYERAAHYLGSFGIDHPGLLVSQCQRSDLLKWIRAHPEWESTFTRQDAVGAVVTCFRWSEDELGIVCPYRRPRFLGPPLRPRPAITPGEYAGMRQHARKAKTRRGRRARTREVFRAGMAFLWRTGARPCEMREALWDRLDWSRAILVVTSKTGKVAGERVIPVRRLLPLLRWLYRRRRKGQRHIFVNSLGKPWTCDRFAKEFRRYARMAGVREEISAYCLRHGLCCRLLEAGVGERQCADVLGHRSTRYVEWYSRELRTKADYLNDVLDKDR